MSVQPHPMVGASVLVLRGCGIKMMGVTSLIVEVPQRTQKSARTVLSPVASALRKLPRLHCLFSTQAGTWLSLTLLDHPVLGQLTSKAPFLCPPCRQPPSTFLTFLTFQMQLLSI